MQQRRRVASRAVNRLRRTAAACLALALTGALAAGCTDDAESPPQDTPVESPDATETEDVQQAIKGKYLYQNAGLRATAEFEGSSGELVIVNRTGRELPEPFLYVREAENGARVDGTMDGSSPIPDGNNDRFRFEFPPEITPQTIGLLFLVLGEDDYGAFIPPAAG